eukprot:scpid109142/ scgid10924/ 
MSTAESVAQYTVVLCGDSTVGKTSLWCALQHLPIPESPSNTPVAGEPVECEYRVCLSTGDWITVGRYYYEKICNIHDFQHLHIAVVGGCPHCSAMSGVCTVTVCVCVC